jgi:SAM-dependent methyltransferase
MEAVEYEVMYRCEEEYWWYVGLHDLVTAHIHQFLGDRRPVQLLDVGCGTGKLLDRCRSYRPFGLEYSREGVRFVQQRGLERVVRASACQIPFPDNTFDLVTSMDVIYHIAAPGDLQALREMRRVLKPGGLLLQNLPAYEWLRSHHDVAIHTQQRYTRRQLREMLREAGLQDVMMSYRNTALFPLAALMRGAQKLVRPNPPAAEAKSDLKTLPRLLNRALMLPLLIENRLIRRGVRFPFGLSVYSVAKKPLAVRSNEGPRTEPIVAQEVN